nr:putative ribonuclease H-like domain-containing protein [Tanacetum cinerariifolium]
MLLEGSELTKEDRESQLYEDFEHFRQHKEESINDYYIRFSKLINDMRYIKMTMPKLQLNSKFVNNMLLEWDRFVTAVKLNKGLRESNYDQLFACLKQHEAHAKKNKMVLERLSQPIAQPTADPLALLSNVSNTQHGLPSSSTSSITPLTPPRANSTDDLIENLTSTLALPTQSYRTFLPQTNNQLQTSSNPRNQATLQDGRVVVQNVHGRPNRGQGMNPWGGNAAGYGEAQNRVRNVNQGQARPGQARTVKCYNCNGTGHIARNSLDAEQLLFLAGGPDNAFDDDVDEQPVQDLALNVDNVFQAEDCDAFDSDVDEAPTAQTIFMANLSSTDPITDEAGPSYDSDILSEVRDHDQYLDDTCAYQEEHVMHDSVQLDHVVDLHADHTSISNMIPYDQYVKDIDVSVVHSNASSVPNDTFIMIYDEMCEPIAPCVSNSSRNAVVKNSLTAELATYREQVELYERRAKFEFTEREQKINEQLILVISDRNFKEETLKWELHSTKLQLTSTINRNKSMVEETIFLKQYFKQKENKLLADFLNMKSLKEKVKDRLVKQDQSLQTVHMLCRPRLLYNDLNKVAIGYKNPLCLTRAKQAQPALYNGHEILKDNHARAKVHDTKDTLEIAAITRKKMNAKMTDPEYGPIREVKQMKDVFEELEAEVTQCAVDRKHDAIDRKNLLIANDNLIDECLSKEVFSMATNSDLNVARFTEMHVANTSVEARCLALEAELATLHKETPDFDSDVVIGKMQASLQGKDNVIRQLKKKISESQATCRDTECTVKVQTTESQLTKVTDPVTNLQTQNDRFRAENDKVKQHYKQLYDSIKITCAKHIEQVTKLTAENVTLKTSGSKAKVQPSVLTRTKHVVDVKLIVPRLKNNRYAHIDYLRHLKESVETIRDIVEEAKVVRPLDRSIVSACRVKRCPKAGGSQPKSNHKTNRISPVKGDNELPVENLPRMNKSHLRTTNCVDSNSRLKRTFIGTVRFGNDHFGAIMGYGDYVVGESVISRVYYVERLGYNLFSVGQFCDFDLEVAFRKHSCYVRDTNGVNLIKGSRGTNLYIISVEDMMKSSLICLLSKASKNKSWLWHRRLNHLNFGTINDLARKDLVRGLPRLKFEKDHLCSACQLGKSKKHTHKPKAENTNLEVLNTLHMDLCGPMRVQTINGKKYILFIMDDYSRFTWVKFLRSKDETPEVVIKFITQIQFGLNKTVRYVRNDNGTEFVNHTMIEYYECIGIFHQKTVPRTPQQNGVVERRNRTLVDAARTMLIFSKAPMFLWTEVVATAVFGALCYPTNDNEDLGMLQPTADTGILLVMLQAGKGIESTTKGPDIFWSDNLLKRKAKALKENAKFAKPITAMTVYPPNTPAKLVSKVLPTKSQGLWYLKDTAMVLAAYANADHAGCQDTRRSTSGSTQFLGDKLSKLREAWLNSNSCRWITSSWTYSPKHYHDNGVAFCLTEFCLKEDNSVKVESKCHYLGSSPHTMTDMTAPTGQAPTMAPPVYSNDQSLPRFRWVQNGYLKFSAKGTKKRSLRDAYSW